VARVARRRLLPLDRDLPGDERHVGAVPIVERHAVAELFERFKAGERITVKPEQVVDWVITDAKGMRGGFSVEVFKKQQEKGGK
jgi:hypothetical protein